MPIIDINKFNNQIVFFGFCPGADFSRRLDTRWKELGICEFQYFDSKIQVKRFASIEVGDLIVLKKRQIIGKTMRVYGYGLVTGITKDDKGNRVLKVDWSSQEQIIEVPLLGCNATIDIRDIDKVRADMPNEFFEWLNQGTEISSSSKPTSKTEADALEDHEIDENSSEQELLDAADNGNMYAMGKLGAEYETGRWGDKDYKKSFEWYMKAANKGWDLAQLKVADAYEEGKGTKKNLKNAFKWYCLAAEQGNAYAQFMLGTIYSEGTMVDKDLRKSFDWYNLSAEQGDAYALYELGAIYEQGIVVNRDLDKAVEYYRKAAENGNEDAVEALEELESNNCDEDIAEGEVVEEVVFEMEMNIEDFEAILNDSPSSKAEPIDIIEIGTTYLVSNKNKKSVWNTRRFAKVNSENNIISHIVGWRSGTFAITPMDMSEASALQAALFRTDDDSEYSFSLGDSVELIETFDCFYDDFDVKKIKDLDEKELKRVRISIKNNDPESLLKAGWREMDRYDWEIVGPVEIEKHKAQKKTKKEKSLHLIDILKNAKKISQKTYENAVVNNQADAQYELGLQLQQLASKESEAELTSEYNELAVWWLQSSALQGNQLAQYALSVMYGSILSYGSEYLEFTWASKSAEQGNADAQFRLAELWYLEDDVPPQFGDDFTENAIKWYELAAMQGHPKAQYALGMLLNENEDDNENALKWIMLAADQNHAKAQYNLGVMYQKGQGVAQDHQQAVTWYRKAAEQGHASAQVNLGVMYKNGQGVAQDDQQAVTWFRKAAEQGEVYAQYNLGVMYQYGEGVPQDDQQAVTWYRKAAEQGHARAQSNLGVMYDQGQGVAQDFQQAVTWYRKAAEQGNASAQYNLGLMYKQGLGVAQDNQQAVTWFRKASEQGIEEASNQLKKLQTN